MKNTCHNYYQGGMKIFTCQCAVHHCLSDGLLGNGLKKENKGYKSFSACKGNINQELSTLL